MAVNPIYQWPVYESPPISDELKKEMQAVYAKVVRERKRDAKPRVTFHQGETLENIMLLKLVTGA